MDLKIETVRAMKRQASALESIAKGLADLNRETHTANTRLAAILRKLEENDGENNRPDAG